MIQKSLVIFSMLLLLPSISFAQDITTGLVGYWTFDEGSGTTASDSSGNNNTGTLTNGPTWTTGKIGSALSFDGSDDDVNVTSFSDITGYPFTLSTWMKPTADGGTFQGALTIDRSATEYYSIGWCNTDHVCLVGRNTSFDRHFSNDNYPLDQWIYVTGVFKSATERELYINGVFDSEDTSSVTELTTIDGIIIGARGGGASGMFSGFIDEVRIYNRALSASDITALYNYTGGPPDTEAPAVSMSSPANESTVSGTITVSANASDNIGVSGVQFLRNGSNLGSEDTTSPYSISWNTTTVSNGSYILSARARDAAGNTTTSNTVTITVSNAVDTTPPSTPANLSATVQSSSQINLSWSASTDNVGVTNYRVERCAGSSCTNFAQIAVPTGTTYSDTGLSANTTYRYRVRAQDGAGNLSGYSVIANETTQSAPPPSANKALLEDFETMRINGNGGPMWESVSNPNQEESVIVIEDGDKRLKTVVHARGNTGPGSEKAVQVQFTPNQGSPRYPFPAGYTRSYIKNGAWDPLFNQLSVWMKCDKDISLGDRETMIIGTYIKSHNHSDANRQGSHYYNFASTKMTANKWVKFQYTWHPGAKVGQSGSIEWGSDPDFASTGYHYWDALTRFYYDMKGSGATFPLTCWTDDWTFSRDDNQNDEVVPSMAAHYTGTNYYVGFNTIKNQKVNYEVRYSPQSMKANGFESGIFGGNVESIGGAYTGVQWKSPPMAENPGGMYFAIRPDGHSDFMELYLPAGIPISGDGDTPPTTPFQGDLNADGTVNTLDWGIMSAVWFTSNAQSDLNSDGIVNSIDFSLLNANWGRTQ